MIKNSTFKPEQTNESLNNNTGSSSPEYLLICQREKRREAIVYNGVDDTFRIFTINQPDRKHDSSLKVML